MNELDFGSLWRMRLTQGFEEKVQLPHIYFKYYNDIHSGKIAV